MKASARKTPRRCYLFPKTLGDSLDFVTAKALKKRGFDKAELVRYWGQIVGEELCPACQPVKLTPAAGQHGGTLYIRAATGFHALELQHREPLILERIAQFYGYYPARRIVILQG